MGQLATKTLAATSGSATGALTTTYGYDGLGTLTSIQYPSTTTFTYTLDALERPTALTGCLRLDHPHEHGVQLREPRHRQG